MRSLDSSIGLLDINRVTFVILYFTLDIFFFASARINGYCIELLVFSAGYLNTIG